MIDVHNHLENELLQTHLKEILVRGKELGVLLQIVNGTCETDWEAVLLLAEQAPCQIIPSIGLHPWKIDAKSKSWFSKLENLIQNSGAWVGEIGIDFYKTDISQKEQEGVFLRQLDLAYRFNRPATVHCIRSWGRLLELLESRGDRLPSFILHSYSGSREMIPQFARLGAFFSYSASVAYPMRKKQRDALANTPIDRLFLETDAPFQLPPKELSSHLFDGSINSPCTIIPLYNYVAKMLGLSCNELISRISANLANCIQGEVH